MKLKFKIVKKFFKVADLNLKKKNFKKKKKKKSNERYNVGNNEEYFLKN